MLDALSDDLNTPKVINALHALHSEGNFHDMAPSLRALGFTGKDAVKKRVLATGEEEKVNRLIDARSAARKAKDFKKADEIRAELDAMGIQLKDSKDPKTGEIVTTWEPKR